MLRLAWAAENESDNHRLMALSSGRNILSNLSEAETRHDNNVVNIDALRLASGLTNRRDSPAGSDADNRDN